MTGANARGSTDCGLAIVGSGMAGLCAAVFAARRNISFAIIGGAGEIAFASGLLDLLGVYPAAEKQVQRNPWEAIDLLVEDDPRHPYGRLQKRDMLSAVDEILAFLENGGLYYRRRPEANVRIVTPLGTLKPTYAVPRTMWAGVTAWEEKSPCLLVDVAGFRCFSARQMQRVLQDPWPKLRSERIVFPESDPGRELSAERMAMYLELPRNREKFVAVLRPLIREARAVGLPAILGLYRPDEVQKDLEAQLGVPVFEVPCPPPSVPGMRLKEAFHQGLTAREARFFYPKEVMTATPRSDGSFLLQVGGARVEHTLRARCVLLATGRFLGRGLHADRTGVRETLFGLPVYQPGARKDWHRKNFLDPRGHPINGAGLEVDGDFRAVDGAGRPVFENLFAAGSILAHQDWMRTMCGSGLAMATAWGAVAAAARRLG